MKLGQIADALHYEREYCEDCRGKKYLYGTAVNGGESRQGPMVCPQCQGAGSLWYPKLADPWFRTQRAPNVGLTSFQLVRLWQQRQTNEQP
jgi:hypothetical protein